MLVLARRADESIVIDGRIRVHVNKVEGDIVKIGIEAPRDIPVFRAEVYQEMQESNQAAGKPQRHSLPVLSTGTTDPAAV